MQKLGDVAAFLWVTAPSCGCMGNGGPDPGFSVPLLSLTTPWTAAYQASLSISNSGSFLTLAGDPGSILGWEDPLEKGKADPLQHSSLENATACAVHGATAFQPGEVHSIPAWRIPQHSSLENATACAVHGATAF